MCLHVYTIKYNNRTKKKKILLLYIKHELIIILYNDLNIKCDIAINFNIYSIK